MKSSILACVACIMVVACGGVDAEYDESESELGTNQAAMTQWAPLIPSAPSGGGLCGNGKLDSGEACDGYRFGGETCVTLGYDTGSLKCNGCTIDTSGCHDAPLSPTECGNGVIETGEQCDGSNLGGRTCKSYGYDMGSLSCLQCKVNLSGCTNIEALDGTEPVRNDRQSGDFATLTCGQADAMGVSDYWIDKCCFGGKPEQFLNLLCSVTETMAAMSSATIRNLQ